VFFRRDRSGGQRLGSRRGEGGRLIVSFEKREDDDDRDGEVGCLRVRYEGTGNHEENDGLVFWVYTSEGDPAERYGVPVKRQVTSTASAESFDRAKTWLEDCCARHVCGKRLPLRNDISPLQSRPLTPGGGEDADSFAPWPSRLIDVLAFGDEPSADVKLVDNSDGRYTQYITLSYCWGRRKRFLRTTSRSMRLRMSRINYTTMPRTFRDVVAISRRLGVRYVWIDALCIVQDDRADWERESVKMGAIYSLAYVTVAADAGEDCESGCFNEQSFGQEESFDSSAIGSAAPFELKSKLPDGTESSIFLWDPGRARRASPVEIDASPLSERGWVCQERILSPRILHYTRTQLFWECRETLLAEDNLRPWAILGGEHASTICGLARNLYGTTTDLEGYRRLLGIWYHQVVSQSYSRRKLTLPDDKLSAISGLARAFSRHLREPYFAGLWLMELAWGLSWRCRRRTPMPPLGLDSRASNEMEDLASMPSAQTSFSSYTSTTSATSAVSAVTSSTAHLPALHPPSYRAPSFAWSSLDAHIEWPPKPLESHIELVTHHAALESSDPFGRVEQGSSMTVRGHVHRARITRRRALTTMATPTKSERGPVGSMWEVRGETDDRWLGMALLDDEDATSDGMMEYLVLGRAEGGNVGLLLEAVAEDGQVSYVRKGIAEMFGVDVDEKDVGDDSLRVVKLI
jgi:Heterokaryon incompatibility protein (HET)